MAQPQPIAGNQDFTSVVDMAAQLPTLNVAELTASEELTSIIRGTPDILIEGEAVTVSATSTSVLKPLNLVSQRTVNINAPGAGGSINLRAVEDIRLDTYSTTSTLEGEVRTIAQVGTINSPVTLNSVAGVITLETGTIVNDTLEFFTLNNSKISIFSCILVTMNATGWPATAEPILNIANQANGSVDICIFNGGAATSGAIPLGRVHFFVFNPIA